MFLRKNGKESVSSYQHEEKRETRFKKKTYLRFPLCKHTVIVWILNINQCFVRQKSGLSSNASFDLKIRRRRLSRFLAKLSNINLPYPSISSEALQFLESSLSHSLLSNTSSRSLYPSSSPCGYVFDDGFSLLKIKN